MTDILLEKVDQKAEVIRLLEIELEAASEQVLEMKAKLETLDTRQCVTDFEACFVDDIKRCFSELNDESRKTQNLPPLKFLYELVKALKKDPTRLMKEWNYVNKVVGNLKAKGYPVRYQIWYLKNAFWL
jgi:hypothetical protein